MSHLNQSIKRAVFSLFFVMLAFSFNKPHRKINPMEINPTRNMGEKNFCGAVSVTKWIALKKRVGVIAVHDTQLN